MKLIEKSARILVVTLGLGITVFLLAQSVYGSAIIDSEEHIVYVKDILFVNIFSVFVVIMLGVLLKKNYKIPILTNNSMRIITIAYIGMLVVFIIALQVMPRADQEKCLYTAAKFLAENYIDWEEGGYCFHYPNQNGLILLFVAIIKIFGKTNWMAVQFLNIPALLFSAIYCSKTVYILFKEEKIARYSYLALLLFIPLNFYVTFIYGTLFGLALGITGIYWIIKYCKEGKCLECIIGGGFIVLAIVCKSNYLIFGVAICLILMYDSIVKKRIKSLVIVLAIIGSYVLVCSSMNKIIEYRTGLEVKGGVPSMAWVAMGLQESYRGPGWYNGYNVNIYSQNNYDIEKTKEEIKENIKNRLEYFAEHKGYTVRFFGRKIASQWNEGTFQGFWINNKDANKRAVEWSSIFTQILENGTKGNTLLTYMLNNYLSVLWCGAIFFLVLERNRVDIYKLIYLIVFIGGFIFHLFWEAKGQYTITYVYLMIPYTIKGYAKVIQVINEYISSKKK